MLSNSMHSGASHSIVRRASTESRREDRPPSYALADARRAVVPTSVDLGATSEGSRRTDAEHTVTIALPQMSIMLRVSVAAGEEARPRAANTYESEPGIAVKPGRDPEIFYVDVRDGSLAEFFEELGERAAANERARRVPEARDAVTIGQPRTKGTALPKWRLRRAVDYIEAHFGEPVTLADLAGSVGLTRMHFAAQFRAATGIRPHEYLLRKRIDRARELLASSEATLIDVAFSVGFQTQAHFTTVFKRFVGETPSQWRRESHLE
ncbi:MAG: hypothetical protein JWL84_3600 [Rhodospirillales bacterium]|nr:hypothetical protein [Rhodospirillales bacterium]